MYCWVLCRLAPRWLPNASLETLNREISQVVLCGRIGGPQGTSGQNCLERREIGEALPEEWITVQQSSIRWKTKVERISWASVVLNTHSYNPSDQRSDLLRRCMKTFVK